jgi:hypothetical protein
MAWVSGDRPPRGTDRAAGGAVLIAAMASVGVGICVLGPPIAETLR